MRFAIQKIWTDTDGMLSVQLSVDRGDGNAVSQEVCFYPKSLTSFAKELQAFPASVTDEIVYEMGPKGEDAYSWMRLRAYVFNPSGHTALQIVSRCNPSPELRSSCQFSLPIEAASLNRLGEELEHWRFESEEPFEFLYQHVP